MEETYNGLARFFLLWYFKTYVLWIMWDCHQTWGQFSLLLHPIQTFKKDLLYYFNYPICFHLPGHKAYGSSTPKDHQVITAIEYQGRVLSWFSQAVLFKWLKTMTYMMLSFCLSTPPASPHTKMPFIPWEHFLYLLNGNFGYAMKDPINKKGLLLRQLSATKQI